MHHFVVCELGGASTKKKNKQEVGGEEDEAEATRKYSLGCIKY